MSAQLIATALGNAHREGRDYRCRCPVHDGVSLTLADGAGGKLLIYCFGGCDSHDVWLALRERGLVEGGPDTPNPEREEERPKRAAAAAKAEADCIKLKIGWARHLYQRGEPAAGTPVEVYLRQPRGIAIAIPPVLRFVRHCPHRNGGYYPAMVAPIVNVVGEQTGIHKTFLKPDGSGKADLPKEERRETCGSMKGGSVPLAPPRNSELLIGEGIESTLSAMQMFGLPGWAALCANGIEALELSGDVRKIVIAADHDRNGTGQHAALRTHDRWVAEGRSVRILLPSNTGEDFNHVLLSRV
jgi:putative DNA primase/helicase